MSYQIEIIQNQAPVGLQYGEESKMHTTEKEVTDSQGECQSESRSLTREEEIQQLIDSTEYRRERAFGKEVLLFAPHKLSTGKFNALQYDPQYELKKDVADALKQFSPAERRIIFRVLIQGQSIDLATKGSKYSTAHWVHWFRTKALPSLRESLKDYQENGKVVI